MRKGLLQLRSSSAERHWNLAGRVTGGWSWEGASQFLSQDRLDWRSGQGLSEVVVLLRNQIQVLRRVYFLEA